MDQDHDMGDQSDKEEGDQKDSERQVCRAGQAGRPWQTSWPGSQTASVWLDWADSASGVGSEGRPQAAS